LVIALERKAPRPDGSQSAIKNPPQRRSLAIALTAVLGGALLLARIFNSPETTLSEVTFLPADLPAGLVQVKEHTDEGESYLRRSISFAEGGTGGPRVELMVATVAYDTTVVDPMEGRLDGTAYAAWPNKRPVAQPIEVRGHQGVLETRTAQATSPPPGGKVQRIKVVALTWIERPGVYIQVIGGNLTKDEVMDVASHLREQ
jgi:hypothetical protein